MAELQKREVDLVDEYHHQLAGCRSAECTARVHGEQDEKIKRLNLQRGDEDARRRKNWIDIEQSDECYVDRSPMKTPCDRAKWAETRQYSRNMAVLQKKEVDISNEQHHAIAQCRAGDRGCVDDAHRENDESIRALNLERRDEEARHRKAWIDIERGDCTDRSITKTDSPPRQPSPVPPGGDPFLIGLGDGFKECGTATREMMLKVPAALLTGNFVEAARLLGVQPGQSMILKMLVEELNRPAIGPKVTPYDAGKRIGTRICSYGLTIHAEPSPGPRPGGTPGLRPPERPPIAGIQKPTPPTAPRPPPTEPTSPRKPQPATPAEPEKPLPRKASPSTFEGVVADSVKQYRLEPPPGGWTAELVGEAGMDAVAAEKGYWPLLPPEKGVIPQGFDGLYYDPKSGAIVVGEAKGGYNGWALDDILGDAYDARQGTLDWAEGAAKRITRSLKASDQEVRYAEQVLFQALRDRKVPIRVEVFHTDFVNGRPGVTRHYVTDHMP